MAFLSRKKVEDNRPITAPPAPGAAQPFWWGGWGSEALTNVSDQSLLGLPAAGYCVNLIANAVATIAPLEAKDASEKEISPNPLLLERPVVGEISFNTYANAVRALICHGNAVFLPVGYDRQGNITQLAPLPANNTRIYLDPAGYKVFTVGDLKLSAEEVVHFAINTSHGDGGIGVGVVEQYRRAGAMQLDQQAFAAGTYKNHGVPPSIISIDADKITSEQASAVREAWLSANLSGRRAPAVVSKAFKFETVAWSPEDMEMLASRQFSVAEMGFMMGISPSYLGASIGGTSQTYANLEQRNNAFVTESVGPYLRVLEAGFSDLLPGAQYASADVERYMRLSTAERDAHDTAGLAGGWLTVDEVRASRGLPPLGQAVDLAEIAEDAA